MDTKSSEFSSIRVRNLPSWVVQTHALRAQHEGDSLEGYLRKLLTDSALAAQHEFAALMQDRRSRIARQWGSRFPDSASLMRSVRDEEL
jgi:plasmid stability protein